MTQNVQVSLLVHIARERAWHYRYYLYLRSIAWDKAGCFNLSPQDYEEHARALNVSVRTVKRMKALCLAEGLIYMKESWYVFKSLNKALKERGLTHKTVAAMPQWALESAEVFKGFIAASYAGMRVRSMNRPKKWDRKGQRLRCNNQRTTRNVGSFASTILSADLGISQATAARWIKNADGRFQKIIERNLTRFENGKVAQMFAEAHGGKLIELATGWAVQRGYRRAYCVKIRISNRFSNSFCFLQSKNLAQPVAVR